MPTFFQLTPNPYPMGPEAGDGEPALLTYTPDRLPTRFPRLWIDGERFTVPPPLPIEVRIEAGEGGRLLDFYDSPLCVMSPSIRALFSDAGVNNLDIYPAVILDETSGSQRTDYFAFNIVGLVETDDLARSELRMARLAESPSTIVVHSSIQAMAEARGIRTLQFHPLKSRP